MPLFRIIPEYPRRPPIRQTSTATATPLILRRFLQIPSVEVAPPQHVTPCPPAPYHSRISAASSHTRPQKCDWVARIPTQRSYGSPCDTTIVSNRGRLTMVSSRPHRPARRCHRKKLGSLRSGPVVRAVRATGHRHVCSPRTRAGLAHWVHRCTLKSCTRRAPPSGAPPSGTASCSGRQRHKVRWRPRTVAQSARPLSRLYHVESILSPRDHKQAHATGWTESLAAIHASLLSGALDAP